MNEIARGLYYLPISFVNAYFVGEPGEPWVLVDTGMPGSAGKIHHAAVQQFGRGTVPQAILLTHGHFDHSGSAKELADLWDVPVYAHPMELPYVTGKSSYPPRDPTVGGAMAFMSRFIPTSSVDLGDRVRPLPPDGAIPCLSGWKWHFTPGHAPGHVSYFRESDCTLLAGDAVTTMDVDSFMDMMTKKPALCRPAPPFTCNWEQARESVRKLAGLRPQVVGAGHGAPMAGSWMPERFQRLAQNMKPPEHGRYVDRPAIADESGIVFLPPPAPDLLPGIALGMGTATLAGMATALYIRRAQE